LQSRKVPIEYVKAFYNAKHVKYYIPNKMM